MGIIVDEFDALAEKLLADFNRSGGIQHNLTKGVAREKALLDLLKDHLPGRYSLGSGGIIVDAYDNQSKAQDIVIYDNHNVPLLQKISGENVYFIEQVLATIEVKSSLTYSEVDDVIEKAKSVNKLGVGSVGNISQVPVFGFAYSSKYEIEQIRDHIQKRVDKEGRDWDVEAIAILKDKNDQSGLVVNVSTNDIGRLMVGARDGGPVAATTTIGQGRTLLMFYLLLMEAVRIATSLARVPDYLSYANIGGLGGIGILVGPLGLDRVQLQKKVAILRNAHTLTDRVVIEAWMDIITYMQEKVGNVIDDNSIFFLEESPLIGAYRPIEVWLACYKYLRGEATTDDIQKINQLLSLLRLVSENPLLYVDIGDLPQGIQKWW